MSVRVVFANRSGFDTPIGVVMAWEERGSCLNIFWRRNRVRISETFTNSKAIHSLRKVVLMLQLESSWHGRSVDHVLTYFGRQIESGFDALIGLVMAWEERRSCLNLFQTKNRGRISETFMNYEAKHLLRKNLHELRGKTLVPQVSETRRFALYLRTGVVLMLQFESSWHGWSVDHVLTYYGREIVVGSQKPAQITRQKTGCGNE
ncbi:uncharacterized protein G2W53_026515 [Senna tora]|uniref:Uncharacterized protein n=1 Tax=Senna tora TaxID=362788 RepID=A0A834WF59_9FABA|nr:uncharacterized protein G2W53_026515 [Senna tora]